MKRVLAIAAFLLTHSLARAVDFTAQCADRSALERVYHAHRTGTKEPFEQAMPQALLERLVREDMRKEAVLRKVYALEITPATLAAEVQRIDTTSRAPEMLAEIKHALGDDAERFAHTMARPILVERELRSRFDNDDRLHAEKRHEAVRARASLRAGKPAEGMEEVIWQLTPRPADEAAELARRAPATAQSPTQGAAKSTSYSVEATAQVSQVIAAPDSAARESAKEKHYFEDLDPQLQNVLRAQLQKPGDVSAVVETPGGFLLFLAKERNAETLRAASLSIPKRSYEEWLAQQAER
jgi:hypothetical protein